MMSEWDQRQLSLDSALRAMTDGEIADRIRTFSAWRKTPSDTDAAVLREAARRLTAHGNRANG